MKTNEILIAAVILGSNIWSISATHYFDRYEISKAQENEAQSNGLEDECKAMLKNPVRPVFHQEPNGDYRLSLFGSERALVCEEKNIQIIQQGDAVNPLIIQCKHAEPNQ